MTRLRLQGSEASRAVCRGYAPGTAAACLGLLLLGGTVSWQLLRQDLVFPLFAAAPVESPADSADGTKSAELPAIPRGKPPAAPGTASAVPETRAPIPLDLNRADIEALQTLPGLGSTLAHRIVAYRESHGPFRRVEQLMDVPGIGAKRYARLQPWLRVAVSP